MPIELLRDLGAELSRRKTEAIARVTTIRQSMEGGRTTVALPDGRVIPVWADVVSQGKLTGAALGATLNPNFTMNWKGADGEFYPLSATEVILVAHGVRAYVQALFDQEAALHAQITAAPSLAAFTAIDIAAGWPSPPTTEANQ